MESSALLSNVALIIAKDLAHDEKLIGHDASDHFLNILVGDDDNDNDEAEEFFLQQQFSKFSKGKSGTHPQPGTQQTLTKFIDIDFLNTFKNGEFENYLHLSKSSFLHIFQLLRDLLLRNSHSSSVSVQTMFSLGLWKLTTDEHFEQIARRFEISFFDCQAAIRQFWDVVTKNSDHFIKWPSKTEILEHTSPISGQHNLKKSIGVVAIKRLDIFLESIDEEAQIIWQIVCDGNKKILDCNVELARTYSFDCTPIGKKLNIQKLPGEGFLIGDSNFPLKCFLMKPFPQPDSEQQRAFNDLLQTPLRVAQDVFDTMAKRFNALYALESKDLSEVRKIVSTICCIQNICVDIEDSYLDAQHQTDDKSVNWSKPISIEPNKCHDSQEGVKRRQALISAEI